MAELEFTVENFVATITLNRPERRNAFTPAMLDDWYNALVECARSDAVRVVVLTGAGTAFCSGGDVGSMKSRSESGETAMESKDFIWKSVARIPRFLLDFDKPYLAAVNGVAAGGGMDVALMSDIIFAAESARFGQTYIRMGVISGDGGAWYLPRLVGLPRALELLWLGDMIDAREAEQIGLVNKVLPDDKLLEHTYGVAQRLASGPTEAIRMMKRSVYQGMASPLLAHLDQVSSHNGVLKSTRDHREAIAAFAEKRKPQFD